TLDGKRIMEPATYSAVVVMVIVTTIVTPRAAVEPGTEDAAPVRYREMSYRPNDSLALSSRRSSPMMEGRRSQLQAVEEDRLPLR
ncbi:MAG TPA: hypothetical protein VGR38_05780, partial [Candidatus Polarisedimenticolia bacterium]|nr:hypothetical protein [Candidatus Polarisedimenticolia bacterium]